MSKPLSKLSKTLLAAAITAVSASAFALTPGGGGSTTKMIIGDSIFALSGEIHEFLEADLNENIDTYAQSGCQVNGTSLICGERGRIPNQYARANTSGIKTVIMNGGGNDFLLGDGGNCRNEACVQEVLFAIEETLAGLYSEIKSDGINEIVFLGYYYTTDRDNNAINDASMDYKASAYPAMGVKFVDMRGRYNTSWIKVDQIHPTRQGSRVLAQAIEEVLD